MMPAQLPWDWVGWIRPFRGASRLRLMGAGAAARESQARAPCDEAAQDFELGWRGLLWGRTAWVDEHHK